MENEKKVINILTAFFISHKSGIKTFLKWIINECPKVLVNNLFKENFYGK